MTNTINIKKLMLNKQHNKYLILQLVVLIQVNLFSMLV